MREETRRLQSEREAIEREKAMLLAGPGGSSSSTAGQTRRHQNHLLASLLGTKARVNKGVASQDEFSGLENVMNSVMEAVDRTKRTRSPVAPPSKIIPGTETFEDLEAFIKRKKVEKLEELKKKK